MRKQDAVFIAFFSGISIVFGLLGLFFFLTPSSDGKEDEIEYLSHANSVLRLFFMIPYVVLAAGFNVQMFVEYGVNYLYIYEVDP